MKEWNGQILFMANSVKEEFESVIRKSLKEYIVSETTRNTDDGIEFWLNIPYAFRYDAELSAMIIRNDVLVVFDIRNKHLISKERFGVEAGRSFDDFEKDSKQKLLCVEPYKFKIINKKELDKEKENK